MVLARDKKKVESKIIELNNMNVPFVVVCGDQFIDKNVVYREARGKWDAINFGTQFIPALAGTIIFNDADTRIYNLSHAFSHFDDGVDLVYCGVRVLDGPQVNFYRILNPIRKKFHVAASGELMLIKREVLERVLPIPPCIAEDSYILFKALELGYRVHFCTETYVVTTRTMNAREEETYKTRTTLGIYQALNYARPPPWIRIFYALLPIVAPLLAITGQSGRAWTRGIEKAIRIHIDESQAPTKF